MPGQDEPKWGTMPSKLNLMSPFGNVPLLHERHDSGPNINIAPGVPHYAPITANPYQCGVHASAVGNEPMFYRPRP
jgi:hypothetical protein